MIDPRDLSLLIFPLFRLLIHGSSKQQMDSLFHFTKQLKDL